MLVATQAVQAELLTPPGESPLLEAYILGFSVDDTVSPPRVKVGVRFPGSQTVTNSYPLGDTWSIQVSAQGSFVEDVQALVAAPFDVTLTPPSGTVEIDVTAGLVAAPPGGQGPQLLLGAADGTRLVAQTARFAAGFAVTWDPASNTATGEPTLDLELTGGHLVLSLAGSDGFLSSFLPETLDLSIDLKGQWRPSTGLVFTGGAALTVTVPLKVEIGPATLTEIVLTLRIGELLAVDVRSTAVLSLGPFAASVEGIGVGANLAYPGRQLRAGRPGLPVPAAPGPRPGRQRGPGNRRRVHPLRRRRPLRRPARAQARHSRRGRGRPAGHEAARRAARVRAAGHHAGDVPADPARLRVRALLGRRPARAQPADRRGRAAQPNGQRHGWPDPGAGGPGPQRAGAPRRPGRGVPADARRGGRRPDAATVLGRARPLRRRRIHRAARPAKDRHPGLGARPASTIPAAASRTCRSGSTSSASSTSRSSWSPSTRC